MATTTLVMLFVSLIFRGALAQPISQDIKSVPSSESTRDLNQSDGPVVSNLNTFRKFSEATEQAISLHGVPFDHVLVRTKRDLIRGNHACADKMVWVWNECIPIKDYEEAKEDDYHDS